MPCEVGGGVICGRMCRAGRGSRIAGRRRALRLTVPMTPLDGVASGYMRVRAHNRGGRVAPLSDELGDDVGHEERNYLDT